MKDVIKLSKMLSYALRHKPDEFGIELDSEGWTSLSGLLVALQGRHKNVSLEGILAVQQHVDKKRFELDVPGDRIRAYYGHSVPDTLDRTPTTPPPILYHGTSPDSLDSILVEGLKPMSRQHVHLSTDLNTAIKTGMRKGSHPVILEIDSRAANLSGIRFYAGNQDVWLSEAIPPEYIKQSDIY